MFQIRLVVAFVTATLVKTYGSEDWNFEKYGADRTIRVNKLGVAMPAPTPIKLLRREVLVMLELAIPVEAEEALDGAQNLLDIAKNKTEGYTYKNIPILRIEAIRSSIEHLNTTHKNITVRKKRGWFDIVGKFLKYTTGVATESDVKLLKSQFMTNHKDLDLSLHKIIINNRVLTNAMKKLVNASIIQKNLLLSTIDRDVLWHRISNTINLAADLVQLSATLSIQYKWMVDQLRMGILPKFVLDNKTVSKILENKDLNNVDSNFISVKPTNKLQKFIVKIPILSNETFTFFEVSPCPIKEISNKALVMVSDQSYKRFVGISNSSFFETSKLPECRKSSSKANYSLCAINIKLFHLSVRSCSKDIILNITEPKCHLSRYRGNEKFFIEKSNESYIIKFFEYTEITVTCRNKKSYRKMKGIVILNPPCLLRSALVTVATNNKIYAKENVKIDNWDTSHFFDSTLQLGEITFSNEEINKINILNKTLEDTLKINLTNIKNENLLWKTSTETHLKINYLFNSGLILVVSLVAIYAAIKWGTKILTKPSEEETKEVFCCVHPANKSGT